MVEHVTQVAAHLVGEIEGRCGGDMGEIWERYRGEIGKIRARYRGDIIWLRACAAPLF